MMLNLGEQSVVVSARIVCKKCELRHSRIDGRVLNVQVVLQSREVMRSASLVTDSCNPRAPHVRLYLERIPIRVRRVQERRKSCDGYRSAAGRQSCRIESQHSIWIRGPVVKLMRIARSRVDDVCTRQVKTADQRRVRAAVQRNRLLHPVVDEAEAAANDEAVLGLHLRQRKGRWTPRESNLRAKVSVAGLVYVAANLHVKAKQRIGSGAEQRSADIVVFLVNRPEVFPTQAEVHSQAVACLPIVLQEYCIVVGADIVRRGGRYTRPRVEISVLRLWCIIYKFPQIAKRVGRPSATGLRIGVLLFSNVHSELQRMVTADQCRDVAYRIVGFVKNSRAVRAEHDTGDAAAGAGIHGIFRKPPRLLRITVQLIEVPARDIEPSLINHRRADDVIPEQRIRVIKPVGMP